MRSAYPLSIVSAAQMSSLLLAFAPGKLRFVESLLSESNAQPSDSQTMKIHISAQNFNRILSAGLS